MAVPCLPAKGQRLYVNISSSSTSSICSKKLWFLIVKDSTDYAWSYFLKEKSELKHVMMSLIKNVKAIYCINIRYVHCDNTGGF